MIARAPYLRPGGNRLLNALPGEERARIVARAEKVSLTTKQLLGVEHQPIDYTYFPVTCVLSMLAWTDEDNFVEVATTGREGMLGVPVLLGVDSMPYRAFCQVPGECYRLPADAFCEEIERGGALRTVVNRYLEMLIVQLAQGGACNGRHSTEQRCARWLLMTRDRIDSDEFPMTQEFLCQMLGVRRATLSEIASRFQDEGYIEYNRGRMRILDVEGLQNVACECYRVLRDEYSRPLLPPDPGSRPRQPSRRR